MKLDTEQIVTDFHSTALHFRSSNTCSDFYFKVCRFFYSAVLCGAAATGGAISCVSLHFKCVFLERRSDTAVRVKEKF